MFDISAPLNLPSGSVRALIALFFAGVTGFLWATSQVVPSELLVITTTVVTYYFAKRDQEGPPEAPIAPVYIPGDTETLA